MEKTPDFLINKDLHKAPEVERTVRVLRRRGEKIPEAKDARVDAYFRFLDRTTQRKEFAEPLKESILAAYTLNTQDPEIVARTAEGLYESEKRLAIAQGRGADIAKLEKAEDVVQKYKPLVFEKAEIQRKTLSSWLDYLQKNDAKQPIWFRYFVVRSLEKMGALDEEKGTYSKRATTTVAPFPELNSEALGWVFKRLTEGLSTELFVAKDSDEQANKEKILALIEGKDFAKLYAKALVETAGKFNRESIEGEWHTYKKGGDWQALERDVAGKGTGWCTAEGSAAGHLAEGDFYVYYTKGDDGAYTQPRIAIRMQGDQIAEVRGTNKRQELEPALVDIAQKKYHNLPGGESYDKKARDMKQMTLLASKQEKGQPLTQSDLVFLYELNSKIEGFGYDDDPRVAELRKTRNPDEDAPIVFGCTKEQIAHDISEIRPDTKAYVGKLQPGVFTRLAGVEHIYSAFPEGRMRQYEIVSGGKTKDKLKQEIKAKYKMEYAESMMDGKGFYVSKNSEQIKLVRLTVGGLGFSKGAKLRDILARAKELGLKLCLPEDGPHFRLQYPDQPMGEWLRIGMEPMADSGGNLIVFSVSARGGGRWLRHGWSDPEAVWSAAYEFVFRR